MDDTFLADHRKILQKASERHTSTSSAGAHARSRPHIWD